MTVYIAFVVAIVFVGVFAASSSIYEYYETKSYCDVDPVERALAVATMTMSGLGAMLAFGVAIVFAAA